MLYSFRQGNRSELLADYLLSSIGIATPIRRQDDIGFDFYCHLSNDEDSNYLTFGFPFIIQIKSSSITSVIYNDNPDTWRKEKIMWLFKNEIPFFIGFVDKEEGNIKIYDTSGLWQLYKNGIVETCSQIELIPRFNSIDKERENNKPVILETWVEGKGDGIKYQIDLGNSIIDLTYDDLKKKNKETLKTKKNILRSFIQVEQWNILHRNLGVNGFNEFKENTTNSGYYIKTGMELKAGNEEAINNIYSSFQTGLISLLINLAVHGRTEECNSLKHFLKFIPPAHYYKQLFDNYPQLFDWVMPLLDKEQV